MLKIKDIKKLKEIFKNEELQIKCNAKQCKYLTDILKQNKIKYFSYTFAKIYFKRIAGKWYGYISNTFDGDKQLFATWGEDISYRKLVKKINGKSEAREIN